jgi:hypothetical protein
MPERTFFLFLSHDGCLLFFRALKLSAGLLFGPGLKISKDGSDTALEKQV